MKRSAKRHSPPGAATALLTEAASAAGYAISRNPVLVGGTTAFLVTMFYVSANALWYQPYFHSGAFVATRTVSPGISNARPDNAEPVRLQAREVQSSDIPAPAPTPEIAATESDAIRTDAITVPVGDEKLRRIQAALSDLGLYSGDLDGLMGPKTRAAIVNYQKIAGHEPTGEPDDRMFDRLAAGQDQGVPPPIPAPRSADIAPTRMAAAEPTDPQISRVQAGLRAFGNEGLDIDGRMGAKTRAALKEFQSLFGLPATGEADEQVLAKMQEIGLIQ